MFVCHRGVPGLSSLGTCVTDDSDYYCGVGPLVPGGPRHARCYKAPDEPIPIPLKGCIDVLSVQRPGAPCTLSLPGMVSGTYSLLLDGVEIKDGYTANQAAGSLELSESVCSRLTTGLPEIRIRVCSP